MAKIIVFVLGFGIVAAGAYFYLYHAAGQSTLSTGQSAPQQLSNVKEAAARIEVQGQQHADEAAKTPDP